MWTEGETVFQLSPELQEAIQQQVLTEQEAWALMDELLEMGNRRPWPEELWPLVARIRLWQAPVYCPLVH